MQTITQVLNDIRLKTVQARGLSFLLALPAAENHTCNLLPDFKDTTGGTIPLDGMM